MSTYNYTIRVTEETMLAWWGLLAICSVALVSVSDACGAVGVAPAIPIPVDGGIVSGKKKKKCLHAQAKVRMADGSVREAGRLIVGDRVWDEKDKTTPVVLTPVTDTRVVQEFIRFETESGHGTTLTSDHAVFARACGRSKDETWPIKPSIQLMVGECVPTVDGEEDVVIKMESVTAKGRVQPITQSGKIVVDGVIVSCYDYAQQNDTQELRHAPFQPARTFYDWAEKIYNAMSDHQYALDVVEGLVSSIGLDRLYK